MGADHEELMFREVAVAEVLVNFYWRASSYGVPIRNFSIRGWL